jgi:cephalosporin-C deacetylase-like acetyl esterase
VVLAYHHRNFGDSDGEPRQELDPWMQVRDYRNAITFVQTLDGVDPERIGIWGTSYAGGHVLVVADADVVCPTDLALAASNRASEPKRLELYPGGHFPSYTDQFDRAAKAATEWFTQHLRP